MLTPYDWFLNSLAFSITRNWLLWWEQAIQFGIVIFIVGAIIILGDKENGKLP